MADRKVMMDNSPAILYPYLAVFSFKAKPLYTITSSSLLMYFIIKSKYSREKNDSLPSPPITNPTS